MAGSALVTGATGFIGGRLARELAERGWQVRCLVRNRGRARDLEKLGLEVVEGDVLDPESIRGVGEGVAVAYYLVHSMGRGGGGDFEERDRRAARNFARMASEDGVPMVVYLGGLGDNPKSSHLASRHRTAEILAAEGPPLTYFRAGMVVGAGSESYRTLRYLVQRLPAMIAPAWLSTPTQPIGIDDVIDYLAKAPEVEESKGREVQIGGPDVLTYGEMLDAMADALGVRRRPKVPIPLLTPWLSSLWIGLVTPVDAGIARPLIEGLSTPTTVTDPAAAQAFGIDPIPFAEALRRALEEDPEYHGSASG
ncbi:MAG TPA: NAD(P)H-binding protein [Solirubrobacterales bacterium]|nr:NAD(P)H-binding protein [Solirubrobacterales bacterium]